MRRRSAPLFEWADRYPHVPAHSLDDTSTEAADDLKDRVSGLRSTIMGILRRHECTVHECATLMHLPVPTVQPRFSELRKMELIADTGSRHINASSGKRAIVWRARKRWFR
jgi:hypothetical protein